MLGRDQGMVLDVVDQLSSPAAVNLIERDAFCELLPPEVGELVRTGRLLPAFFPQFHALSDYL